MNKMAACMVLTLVSMAIPTAASAAPAAPAAQAKAIGQCMVRADRAGAVSAFQRQPIDGSAADLSVTGECGKGAGGITGMQLRGGIAEALYARDFREAGIQPRWPINDLARLDLPEGAADTNGRFAAGTCVARKRFADIDKLFATSPGSDREDRFIEELMPYFSICQVRGTRVALKRGELRSLIAQTVYAENARYWRFQAASR